MSNEKFELNEKLEQLETAALENVDEVAPIESNEEKLETSECVEEPQVEMSTCTCMNSCGSNYSRGDCVCMNNCGNNYSKG